MKFRNCFFSNPLNFYTSLCFFTNLRVSGIVGRGENLNFSQSTEHMSHSTVPVLGGYFTQWWYTFKKFLDSRLTKKNNMANSNLVSHFPWI